MDNGPLTKSRMKALLINPLIVATAAVVGLVICRATGSNPHLREMWMAAIVCLVAVEAGMLPLLLYRGALPMHPAQAGLLATMLHLMLASMIGGCLLLFLHPPLAFVFWLLAFYWLTLIAISVAAVRVVRSSATGELKTSS